MSADTFREWGPVLCGCIGILITVAGWLWTQARSSQANEQTAARVASIDATGSAFSRETRWKTDAHEKEISELRAQMKETSGEVRSQASGLADVKKDIQYIAEWVRDQRRERND